MSSFDNISGHEPAMFVTKPAEQFDCPLCLNVLNDPRQCINGHCFCFDCISTALTKCKSCPMCKVELNTASLSKNLMIGSLIDDMPAYCVCREELTALKTDDTTNISGEVYCQWIGKFQSRRNHYDKWCEHFKVACPNNGCDLMIKRHQLPNHIESDCLFRISTCKYCNCADKFTLDELGDHYKSCEQYLVPCPNIGCEKWIARSAVKHHVNHECYHTLEECPLAILCICKTCTGPQPRHILHAKHASNPWEIIEHYRSLSSKAKYFEEQVYAVNIKYEDAVSKLEKTSEMVEKVQKASDVLVQRMEKIEARDQGTTTTNSESTIGEEVRNSVHQTEAPPGTSGHKFNKAQKKKMTRFNELLDVFGLPSTTSVDAKPIFDEVEVMFRSCSSVMRLEFVKTFGGRFVLVDLDRNDFREYLLYTELFEQAFVRAPELYLAFGEFPDSKHMSVLMKIVEGEEQTQKQYWMTSCLHVSGATSKTVDGYYYAQDRYFVRMLSKDLKDIKRQGSCRQDKSSVHVLKEVKNEWKLFELGADDTEVVFYRAKANFWETFPPGDAKWRSVDPVTGRETEDIALKIAVTTNCLTDR